jgi:hypothetical protein
MAYPQVTLVVKELYRGEPKRLVSIRFKPVRFQSFRHHSIKARRRQGWSEEREDGRLDEWNGAGI